MVQRTIHLPEKLSFFLFGPRQTGKSTLVETVFTDQTWTVDFLLSDTFYLYERDPSQFREDALYKIEKESVSTIVIDEVQRLPVLLNEVHFLLEKLRHIRFVLTGSSARKLKRGASNLLAGRAVERHLYPFVWSEISGHLDLETMLHFGTLPGVYELNPGGKKEALRAHVNTCLKEEIRSEALTRKLSSFSQFLDIAGAQFGHQLNFTAIGRDVGLSTKTVQIWYKILEDTLIGFRLDPWRKSVRKRLSARPEFYFFDCGVTNAVNRVVSGDFDHFYRGRLFEQFLLLVVGPPKAPR
jgi:predicted AAA+ superfamily ATPase